ncbi:MAG: hypothetical protein D3910_04880 [Candidatus Electrothrix sp. ATG2]|nr:hypothetical protein [Candidatus Electrothrix sp. ATG2]
MKSGQMSINKLVIHLELAVLGLVLLVLLLSALDQGGDTGGDGTTVQNEPEQIIAGKAKDVQASRTTLFADVHVPPRQRETWLGDLDGMLKRGQLRVLIPFSRTFFFQANGQELGLNAEILKFYEQFLNEQVVLGEKKMELVFLPTPQEHLVHDLLAGKGDIAVADMQLGPEEKKSVTFVSPVAAEIREILITGPDSPQFKNIFNLSGQTITVRKNSSYAASIHKLNNTLLSIGKKPVSIHIADAALEDEDLLEMTATGLLPITVVDSHIGEFWAHVFHNLKLHKKIAVRTAKEITWMIRADAQIAWLVAKGVWHIILNESCEGDDCDQDRLPPGSKPIDKTPWSGDHGEIKDGIGNGPADDTWISPDDHVWSQNPDGTYQDHGPAGDYTGSGKPSGRRGKDRRKRWR